MQDKADVNVLPPIIPLVGLALGILAAVLFPMKLLPSGVAVTVGLVIIAASIFLALSAAREMRCAETAFDVRKPTSAIVATGPFAFSRNPVYLSMMLLCVGAAFLANSFWMLLLVLPIGTVLCLAVIKPEERYLEGKFGEPYRAYRARVRRWI